MKMNKIIIIPLLVLVVLVIGTSYAFYTKTSDTNRKISLTTGNKYVGVYGDNKDSIELNKDYTFTIENRGIVNTGYEVYIESETSINLSNISYTVTGDYSKTGNLSDNVIVYSALASGDSKTINIKLTGTGEYSGKIKVRYKDYVENFNYNGTNGVDGSEQTFIIPTSGHYEIEAWGAQGAVGKGQSEYISTGGYGGYSVGVINPNKNTILYINVGGQGGITTTGDTTKVGGYNGGNSSGGYLWGGAGSGGATHIALVSGLLSTLESYKGSLDSTKSYYVSEKILLVAGGGGVFCPFIQRSSSINCTTANGGSNGGGFKGMYGNLGGTQTSGGIATYNGEDDPDGYGKFGKGAGFHRSGTSASSGGGGFYGGASINNQSGGCGGGGSSYIASSNLITYKNITKHMTCYNCTTSTVSNTKTITNSLVSSTAKSDYSKQGHGYVRITYINE